MYLCPKSILYITNIELISTDFLPKTTIICLWNTAILSIHAAGKHSRPNVVQRHVACGQKWGKIKKFKKTFGEKLYLCLEIHYCTALENKSRLKHNMKVSILSYSSKSLRYPQASKCVCVLSWVLSVKERSKGFYYRHYKLIFNTENNIFNLPDLYVIALMKFRHSCHKLQVEIGRKYGILR